MELCLWTEMCNANRGVSVDETHQSSCTELPKQNSFIVYGCLWAALWYHSTIDLSHLNSIVQWFRFTCIGRALTWHVSVTDVLTFWLGSRWCCQQWPKHCKSRPLRGIYARMENILVVCNRNHSIFVGGEDIFVFSHFSVMSLLIPLNPAVYIYSICDLKRRYSGLFVIPS